LPAAEGRPLQLEAVVEVERALEAEYRERPALATAERLCAGALRDEHGTAENQYQSDAPHGAQA